MFLGKCFFSIRDAYLSNRLQTSCKTIIVKHRVQAGFVPKEAVLQEVWQSKLYM